MFKFELPKVKSVLDLGLFLFTVKAGYDISMIISPGLYLDTLVIVIALFAYIVVIMKQEYSFSTLVKYILIGVISLVSTFLSGQSAIIVTVITILAIRTDNISNVIYKIYKWSCLFFLIHSLFYVVLLVTNNVQLYTIDAQNRIRFSFGFVHANALSIYIFNLVLMWCWLNFNRINKKHIKLIFLLGTVVFIFSDSKTLYCCIMMLCILLLFVKKHMRIGLHLVAKLSVLILSSILYMCFYIWKEKYRLVLFLDMLLTGRIKLGAYSLYNYGITLLGQKLPLGELKWTFEWEMNYFTLDCTYTSLITNIGVVWLVIIIICFIKLADIKSNKINIFLVLWSMYALTEVYGLNVYLCFPLLLVSRLLDHRTSKLFYLLERGNDNVSK